MNGTTLVANIYDDGTAFTLDNYGVRFRMKLPYSVAAYYVDGTVSGSAATFAIDEAYAASVAGVTDTAYVEVLDGDTVVCSTNRMRVVVLESAYDGVPPAHIWDNGITQFLADAQDAVDDAVNDADAATTRATQAAEAAEGVILDALPTMTANLKGGAKLGSGLEIDSDTLSIDLTDEATGESVTAADASYLASLTVDGKAVQNGTPTPSAPVDVQVVQGVNLLSQNSETQYSTAGWTIGGSSTGVYIDFEQGIYSISVECTTAASGKQLAVGFMDANDSSVGGVNLSMAATGRVSATLTLSGKAVRVRAYLDGGAFKNFQIEKGSTATPYIPYGSIGLKVQNKKNLLNSEAYSRVINGVTFTVNNDKSITAIGTATAQVVLNVVTSLPLDTSKTYTLSGCSGGSSTTYGLARDYLGICYDEPVTATTTQSNKAVYIFIRSGVEINTTFYPQLEEGSAATRYTPYLDTATPIDLQGEVLAGISDVKDVLNIDSVGHKLKDKRIGVVDLGTLEWTMQSSGVSGKYRAKSYITDIKMASSSGSVPNVICSRFAAITENAAWNMTNGVSVASNEHAIYCCDDNYSSSDSAAAFKTAMSGVLLYYELATPQTIDLGYIDMPAIPDGAEISITAQVTPTITASWWARGAAAIAEALKAVRARINAIEAAIAELATA